MGLSITGNVMVDRRFLERAGNVVLDQTSSLDAFRVWAKAGTANGAQLFMQRSTTRGGSARGPRRKSRWLLADGLDLLGLFARPRALRAGTRSRR
ncbi:MAG: hypothetical protein IPH72_09880 [Sandaracinaceae bacterium]|nr:hypothetical protein [Sandaracinaceae bacterium]